MVLSGTFEIKKDEKHRLSIPFVLRKKLGDLGQDFAIMPGDVDGTLSLYPDRVFDKLYGGFPGLNGMSPDAEAWLRYRLGLAMPCESDSQGRVSIPERLIKLSGLKEDEVALIGVGDHLELWAREPYEKFVADMHKNAKARRAAAEDEMLSVRAKQNSNATPAAEAGDGR